MNEQIKQLLKQATDTVEIVNPDTGITHHREFFDKEKFAELIVKECVAICQDIDGEDSQDGRCARQDCAVEIRQHFGMME